MHSLLQYFFPLLVPALTKQPEVNNVFGCNVTYLGKYQAGVEGFLGISYAKSTAGKNRFEAPIPFTPQPHSTIHATDGGKACPQDYSEGPAISEDCLKLNIWRPANTTPDAKLPVLVWIYGGSFVDGWKDDPQTFPGGLINQSVANGHPVIHASMNYRLGIFGFAQSGYLKKTQNENNGLRDQRLALEWLENNIAAFGGDPEKMAIHGQSSGGLSVGMQTMAYGASRPVPFRAGIAESQAVEPGITGNFTKVAQKAILADTGCDKYDYDSEAAMECLRKLSMKDLFLSQNRTACDCADQNEGDQWLPVVDGDFLPEAPSELIAKGKLAGVDLIVGWTHNDATQYTAESLDDNATARSFIEAYLPALNSSNVDLALSLYSQSDFHDSFNPDGSVAIAAEIYRAAKIWRDVMFTCSAVNLAEGVSRIQKGAPGKRVYLYDVNQTILTDSFESQGEYGYGVVHTSEIPYVFDQLGYYYTNDTDASPVDITASDRKLADHVAGSWSTFTALGVPSLEGHETLPNWQPAQFQDENLGTYVIGGPTPGFAGSGGDAAARKALSSSDKLLLRCRFWNGGNVPSQLQY
ncbi:Carboxylic ester hydrolase [Cercospora zeina]